MKTHSIRTLVIRWPAAIAPLLGAVGALLVAPANALNISLPGCAPFAVETITLDNGATVAEDIFAVPSAAGDILWSLGAADVPTQTDCPQTPPAPNPVESLTCASNGLTFALPAGAPAAGVSSAIPATLTASPISATGTSLFSVTATLDDGTGLETCSIFLQVDVIDPVEPFDMVWVLDRSGSMVLGSGSTTRWGALENGATQLLGFLPAVSPPGSRFGLTLFDSNVVAPDPLGGMINIDPDPDATTNPFILAVEPHLSQSPGGLTAMGAGIQDAMAKMTDAARPRVIMLFTDGEENQPPDVNDDGCGFTNPTSLLNPDCPATSGYKVVATGIGSPSMGYLSTLEALAGNNRGVYLSTDNGDSFTYELEPGTPLTTNAGATFEAAIEPALSGTSPQQVAFFSGRMLPDPSAPAPVVLPGFDVNRNVDKLLLAVTFSDSFETPNLLQLVGAITVERNGEDVTSLFRPTIVGNFGNGTTLVANFVPPIDVDTGAAATAAPVGSEGNYVVTLRLPPSFDNDLEYRLRAYADDHRFRLETTLTPAVKRVNAPIDVSIQLDYLSEPVEDATVVVRAFGPATDMGETLSQGPAIDPSGTEDASNAGIQKYDDLAANDPAFLAQIALSPNAVAMSHAGGGVYTGTYNAPDNVGVVHFVYNVSAENDLLGRLQRTGFQSAYLRFDEVDMTSSNPQFAQLDRGLMQLTLTPVRPSGKPIGPGALSSFQFTGVAIQDSRDNQDGSYTFIVSGGDPDTSIGLTLLDTEVYSGPANWSGEDLDEGLIGLLLHYWWLVLLLLILIIFLILRSRSSP